MSQLGRLPVGSLRALAVARVGVSDRRAQDHGCRVNPWTQYSKSSAAAETRPRPVVLRERRTGTLTNGIKQAAQAIAAQSVVSKDQFVNIVY